MNYSNKFEKIKMYYNKNFWNIKKVYAAVGKWITADDYKEITGENYK